MNRHAKIGRRYHGKWGLPCRNPLFLHDSPKLNDVILVNGGSTKMASPGLSRNFDMLVEIPGGDVFQLSDQASAEKNHAFYDCFLHF